MRRLWIWLCLAFLATTASAQDRIPSHCIALSAAEPLLWPANYPDPVPLGAVRIRYLDHAMFMIQTPGGLTAMTDFTGWFGTARLIPDVVTMNNAHSTHWTSAPDPAIAHVLEGWARGGVAADHYLDLGEMLIRNVPTDVLNRDGLRGRREDGNSIFVFETAGLCIGHMGHLHHVPTARDYASLGRVDVVMIAVDGGLTLDLPRVLQVMERLRARVVIPMHWFGRQTLEAFILGMEEAGYRVVRDTGPEVILSLATLPDAPTVLVLEPELLYDDDE